MASRGHVAAALSGRGQVSFLGSPAARAISHLAGRTDDRSSMANFRSFLERRDGVHFKADEGESAANQVEPYQPFSWRAT